MTTHSDHNDADHEPQSNGNDLINDFFSSQGTTILQILKVGLLRLLDDQTLVNLR